MILWIDAQLSPALAPWVRETFDIETHAVHDLHLLTAKDSEIFQRARDAEAVIMSKDRDFLRLLDQFGPPPQVLWVTCGNTSNARLRAVLSKTLPKVLALLRQGEPLVEIGEVQH